MLKTTFWKYQKPNIRASWRVFVWGFEIEASPLPSSPSGWAPSDAALVIKVACFEEIPDGFPSFLFKWKILRLECLL